MSRLLGEAEVALDVDLDPQALAVEPVLVALVLAEHRVEALEEVLVGRPQAWWTPIGLLAVIGPSRKLQRGPPAFWARSRANVRRSRHWARISCSWATRSGFELTGRNIRPRVSGAAEWSVAPWRRRGCSFDGSEYPTRDARTTRARGRARGRRSRRVPLPALPRPRPAYAGAPMRALAFAAPPILLIALVAGVVLRLTRVELVGLVLNPCVLSSVFVAQPRRPRLPARRDRRRLPRRRVPEPPRRRRRRPAGPAAPAAQPAVDRRPRSPSSW